MSSPAERYIAAPTWRPHVYVAGPMRLAPDGGIASAVAAADRLLQRDVIPFVPQLCVEWKRVSPLHDDEAIYQKFLIYDFAWIARCDGLLRLPGESFGADEEIKVARFMGKPVFYSVEECLEFYRRSPL